MDGYDLRPIDTDESRYENSQRNWEIIPILSCSNTGFGGEDPAADPAPMGDTPAEQATMLPPEELELRATGEA